MSNRDSVWLRQSDNTRMRMHVEPGSAEDEQKPSVMTLTAVGEGLDGSKGEQWILVGSLPAEASL